MKRIIFKKQPYIFSCLSDGNEVIDIDIYSKSDLCISDIYIGRVTKILKNINAVFIEISPGIITYYDYGSYKMPIFTHQAHDNKITCGDEVIVQLEKMGSREKLPSVTGRISIPGVYLVLMESLNTVKVSKKIENEHEREFLKDMLMNEKTNECGFIVRTNAYFADYDDILKEARHLKQIYNDILNNSEYKTCYSVLFRAEEEYIRGINDTRRDFLSEVVTDDREIFDRLKNYYFKDDVTWDSKKKYEYHQGDIFFDNYKPPFSVSFYEDPLLPIERKYCITDAIRNALKKKIWLNSGAYIFVEQTEAMAVIDVNTGKSSASKKHASKYEAQEHYYSVNIEAAKEAAHQIRLRNISGIIAVDFIDMESDYHKKELLKALARFLSEDPVKSTVIDMTPLGIVELTRKKKRLSLSELLDKSEVWW